MQLRRLCNSEKASNSTCVGIQTDICICGTGFWDASKDDLYKLCDAHGIRHTEGMLHKLQTTHVVVPFTLKDIEVCQAYARRVLTSNKISKALSWGIPIVSIDFLLHTVGKGCRSCHELIPGIPASMLETGYACPADCFPVTHSEDHVVDDTPSKYIVNPGCSSSGVSTLVHGVMEPEGESMTSQLENEITCAPKQHEERNTIISWDGGYDDDVDPCQSEEVCGSQTPGTDAFNKEDLRNFASIKVTPLSCHDSEKEHDETIGDFSPGSSPTLVEETPLQPWSPDCFIPGELLSRAPKGNGVRKRHNITSKSSGMIQFTDSMTFRHLEYLYIDARNHRAVEIVDLDRSMTKAIVKPLHFYKIMGEEWMMEFKRYFTGEDIGVSDGSNGLELYQSTKVEGCPVHAVTRRQVVVHRMRSRHKKGPMLAMESSDDPPYFYRHDYDVDAGRVLDQNLET